MRKQIALVPRANRRIVTYHDAFPYYARAYGITIVGVAVAAPGQEPSARVEGELARGETPRPRHADFLGMTGEGD